MNDIYPARKAMRDFRKANDLSAEEAANLCNMSGTLYNMVESGSVTHPNKAERIGEVMGLSELQIEELMPENHRKHSPNYDPEKYVEHVGNFHASYKGEVTWIQKEDE